MALEHDAHRAREEARGARQALAELQATLAGGAFDGERVAVASTVEDLVRAADINEEAAPQKVRRACKEGGKQKWPRLCPGVWALTRQPRP